MTCSREDTEEGRERGRVSTETRKKPGRGIYLLPLAVAVPAAAAILYAGIRFWPKVYQLINILIKVVVRS